MRRAVAASLLGLWMADTRSADCAAKAPRPSKVLRARGTSGSGERVPSGPSHGGQVASMDLADPRLHSEESRPDGTPKFRNKRFTGPVFVDGVAPADVRQGQIGDCYFLAAVASIAGSQPEAIQNALKDNGDGTYTVTFKARQTDGGPYVDKHVTVDGDLPVRSFGGPLYGRSGGSNAPENMEMWFPILEKAYAAMFPDGYDAIGNGGVPSSVMEAILGRPPWELFTDGTSEERVWQHVKASLDSKTPVTAGTFSDADDARYANTGVFTDHSYSVLGYTEFNGARYFQLRNPWGESEPWPGDGKNDGVFFLKLDAFVKLFSTLSTVR